MTNYEYLLEVLWVCALMFGGVALLVEFLPDHVVDMLGEEPRDAIINILGVAAVVFFVAWGVMSGLDYFVFGL